MKIFTSFCLSLVTFQEKSHYGEAHPDEVRSELNAEADFTNLPTLSHSSSMRDGSDFRIIGDFQNPREIIKRSSDFESVIVVLQQLKCDEEFQPKSLVTEKQRKEIARRDSEVEEMREKLAQMTEGNAHGILAEQCCNLLKDIGPPWNWLHNFASQTCREKSYNFLESVRSDATPNEVPSSEDSFDYLNDKFVSCKPSAASITSKSSASVASGITLSVCNVDEEDDRASKNHKVLIETICSISEASDKGDCNIRETSSIASFLEEQHTKKQLDMSDYQLLKKFIERAEERQLVFNDLNELYNYFIQEASRERSTHEVEICEDDEDEAEVENVIETVAQPKENEASHVAEKIEKPDSKNVVSIFGESGIEVDGRLLDAKVSESMILGLVDKPQHLEDNVSDVASSISSLSQAETVKQQNVTQEKDTQTVSYKEQIHSKRVQCKQVGKSKSASSIKRQPFACKIPPLPGIGSAIDSAKLEKILRFIAHRSFQQGGFVYPRNFMEDECPSLT